MNATPTANFGQMFKTRWGLLAVLILGLAARMAAALLGHNYDMDSWYIVADITARGGNVYAETQRYNYGPVWFHIVHWLDLLAGHRHEVLRYLIAFFLSLVDAGVFGLLCRRAGPLAGTLFFMNPISILITGYHCQFDNLAVLLGIGAVLLFGDDFKQPVGRRKAGGLLLLGLSLMTKHLFIFFPIWLAVKQKGFVQRVIILCVPVVVFLLGFAPYWAGGREGIIHNVFGYGSSNSNFFYKFFVPQCVQFCLSSQAVWLGLLVLFAFVCRARNGFESLLIYSGALVAFSPSTTNQYLAIPCALMAVFPNVPFAIYTALAVFHLCADARNGPHLWPGLNGYYQDLAIYALCFAMAWLFLRKQFLQLLERIRGEIRTQLDLMK